MLWGEGSSHPPKPHLLRTLFLGFDFAIPSFCSLLPCLLVSVLMFVVLGSSSQAIKALLFAGKSCFPFGGDGGCKPTNEPKPKTKKQGES